MGYFVFGGVRSQDLGLTIESPPDIIKPQKRLEIVPVPGRMGNIAVWDGSWTDTSVAYKVWFKESSGNTLLSMAGDIYRYLARPDVLVDPYLPLQDSYGVDHNGNMFTRMAYLSSEVAIEDLIRYGRTTLRFSCRPQVYGPGEFDPISFGTEEIELTGNTFYSAEPLIIVRAKGTITVNGTETITIGNMPPNSHVYIDCADKVVYYYSNMKKYSWMASVTMTGDFPIIPAGGDQGEQGILTLSFARRSGTAQADDATVTPRRFVI